MSLRHTAKTVGSAVPLFRRAIQLGGRLVARSPKFQDLYSSALPCQQTAFDIFSGEWSSAVPNVQTGTSPLFNDARIRWLREQLGTFRGKRILELGPLEGGQTCMMEEDGAEVTAIEANQRAFLKCLVVKNAMNMKAKFLYGDFRPYLASTSDSFDLVTAIGVLYHMMEPAKLLTDISRVTNAFFVWTHYYDAHLIGDNRLHFDPTPRKETVNGKSFEVYLQSYLTSVTHRGFCGGTAATSVWMTRQALLDCVENLGFHITIGAEALDHPNGPALSFLARRQP